MPGGKSLCCARRRKKKRQGSEGGGGGVRGSPPHTPHHHLPPHTPTLPPSSNTASKFWIGGAGQHAKISAVFAQLTVAGAYVGPHVFVVRLRDDAGRLCPGVRIKDCGAKAGLNGVDNGQLWFDGVRVPRAALLNKYADVAPDGAYTSPIPTVGARFGVTVGGLTSGRVLIAQGAVNGAALATTIALRFASSRTQFADGSGKEVPILTYPTTRERLLPALASTLAHHAAIGRLKKLFAGGGDPKEVHILSSCLKASATWARRDSQQAARECCGGMGFLSANRIGEYRNDQDVDVTFEGRGRGGEGRQERVGVGPLPRTHPFPPLRR